MRLIDNLLEPWRARKRGIQGWVCKECVTIVGHPLEWQVHTLVTHHALHRPSAGNVHLGLWKPEDGRDALTMVISGIPEGMGFREFERSPLNPSGIQVFYDREGRP